MILDIRYDFQRSDRIGILEAIWGEDKTIDQLKRVTKSVLNKNKIVFITRIDKKKAKILSSLYPKAEFYEDNMKIISEEIHYDLKKNTVIKSINATIINS